jgi:lipoprotein-releasing system permease protein
MLVSISIVKGFQNEIIKKVTGFSGHIQISHANINYTYQNEPLTFSQPNYNNIQNLEEVEKIQVYAYKPGIIKTDDEIEGIVLKGISNDFDWSYLDEVMVKGSKITINDSDLYSKDIVISENLAKKLNLDVGDGLIIYFIEKKPKARKLTISGIYNTGLEEADNVFALCDLRMLRKLNKWEDNQIGGYEVRLRNFDHIDKMNSEIRHMVKLEEETKRIHKDIYPQIFDWLSILNNNVQIIIILMIIVAIVNMITALLIIILEKTQFVGIFKSMGLENKRLQSIFIYVAGYIILYSMLIGNALGFSIMLLQKYFDIIKLPVETYFIDTVPILFRWDLFILINIGAFVLCLVFMFLPVLFISKIKPVKIIRFE